MEKKTYKPTIGIFRSTTDRRKFRGKMLLLFIVVLTSASPITSEAVNKSETSDFNETAPISMQVDNNDVFYKQSIDDKSNVLQKCVNLTELQPFYPKNPDGSLKQLNVMQHGVSFSPGNLVAHAGKSLNYLSKEQIKSRNVDAYFYFHELKIEQNSAKVDFVYNYDQSTPSPKRQVVSLELLKTSDGWNVAKSKMEVK